MTAVQPLNHRLFLEPRPADQTLAPLITSTVYLEVIAPTQARPELPGWRLLVWPHARLGDLTLEALPEQPAPLAELLDGLRDLGFTPLGYRVHT